MASNLSKPCLLLVDDDHDVLDNFKELFINAGYKDICRVITSSSSEKAINRAEKLREDGDEIGLLITDMLLPGLLGYEVAEKIKDIFPNCVTAVLTGESSFEDTHLAINRGKISAHFKKGMPKKQMFLSVNELLKQYFSKTHRDIGFVLRQLTDDPKDAPLIENYATSRYIIWMNEGRRDQNTQWIDMDEYDFHSKMIVAIEESFTHSNHLVGGLRKIYPHDETGTKPLLKDIMKKKQFDFSPGDLREHRDVHRTELIHEKQIDAYLPKESLLWEELKESGLSAEDFFKQSFGRIKYEVDIKKGTVKKYAVADKRRLCEIPALKIHNRCGELQSFLEKLTKAGRSFAELGRFGILANYRTDYYGIRLDNRMIEEAIAESIVSGTKDIIICCNPTHYKFFYQKMGVEPIPGIHMETYYVGAPSMAYRLDVKNLFNPEKVNIKTSIAERIHAYSEKLKRIKDDQNDHVSCTCANHLHCLNEKNYLVPIDETVEHHCPIRVQRFLQTNCFKMHTC